MYNVNLNSPFTEIFTQLEYIRSHTNDVNQKKGDYVLQASIVRHIDNSIGLLMQGLQDVGQMLGFIMQHDAALLQDLNSIGFFISAISNLTEALNTLRMRSRSKVKN